MSAAAETTIASCQLSQRPTDTPPAGGVIPRPRLLIRYGAIRRSADPTTTPYQRRGRRRRQSHTPAMVQSDPASASAPAEPESGPRSDRKKVAGENTDWRLSAPPTGARTASQRSPPRTANRSEGSAVRASATHMASRRSQVAIRLPPPYARCLAVPCSGGTGRTLKRSRGPAVVGSS